MNDTSPAIEKKWHELMLKRSPQDRLMMAMSMFASAKLLMRAEILAAHPSLPERLIKKEMLFRLYKNDFSEKVLEEISQKLFSGPPSTFFLLSFPYWYMGLTTIERFRAIFMSPPQKPYEMGLPGN